MILMNLPRMDALQHKNGITENFRQSRLSCIPAENETDISFFITETLC